MFFSDSSISQCVKYELTKQLDMKDNNPNQVLT